MRLYSIPWRRWQEANFPQWEVISQGSEQISFQHRPHLAGPNTLTAHHSYWQQLSVRKSQACFRRSLAWLTHSRPFVAQTRDGQLSPGQHVQIKNKFREDLIAYFPLILHGPHRKLRAQQFCCVSISSRGDVFTEPMASNDRERQRLMGGIYEVRRWDVLRCHGIHTKFIKDWFRHSKVEGKRHTDTQNGDLISLLYVLKIRKLG
jgi:hypothetical protein